MKKILQQASLALGSILALSLVLEAILSLGGAPAGLPIRVVPGKGMTYIPGAAYVHSKEGFSHNRFNTHGFRDRERSWDKPENTYRILVLGDSYVEAMQVDLDESFPALMEDALNQESDERRFEVIALGQSGFGTTDALVRFRQFGRNYNPDLVILTVTTANDFRNNHRELNGHAIGYYYVRDEDGRLVLDDTLLRAYEHNYGPLRRAYTWLRLRSRLVSLISRRLQLLRRGWKQGPEGTEGEAGGLLEAGSDLNIYVEHAGEKWDEALSITHDVLLMAVGEFEEAGAGVLVVSLTNAEQVDREIGSSLQTGTDLPLDYGRPERLLAEWCREAGVPFLPLVPAFQAAYDEKAVSLHGFGERRTGHWNEAGHRLAATVILDYLKSAGLIPQPAQSHAAPGPHPAPGI